VALIGLFIAHRLSAGRDRRKEIGDLCARVKELVEVATDSAATVWDGATPKARAEAIPKTRRYFQSAGIAHTDLQNRTMRVARWLTIKRLWNRPRITDPWRNSLGDFLERTPTIDASRELLALRKVAMQDPFDDVAHQRDPKVVEEIEAGLAAFQSAINRALARAYP